MTLSNAHCRTRLLAALFGALAYVAPAIAQTHRVAKPENVVRAVGVYEWTGDMAKPTASRLIPVSLFIDAKFEDAAIYRAAPMPFAILTGNVYEIQKTGVPLGTLQLAFAKHFFANPDAAVTPYDDGWFGYGKFLPPVAAKPSTLKASANLARISDDADDNDDRPHFSSRSATPGTGGAATPLPGSPSATTDAPGSDPDRPTLHKSSSGGTGTDTASTDPTPADPNDPDRPTLRRRSAAESKQAAKEADQGSVSAAGPALDDDPNRPTLHRGKPVGALNETDIPKLMGLPGDQDLHQLVAVSDAADRPVHDFARAWDGDDERAAILSKMQTEARAELTAYEAANKAGAATGPPPMLPTPAKTHTASRARHTVTRPTPPPPPAPLLEEQLTGYTLSYGGAATYVYHAHTDGLGATERFVTLVAQADPQNQLQFALKNVTDAAHLDRTPRMRLVDAVDAEASNRASLLFELRAQNSRQFALYRVLGGRAEQIFVTGSTVSQ